MATATKWIGNWSDDVESVRDLARYLRAEGIKAKTDYSPYVGHRTLKIAAQDVEQAKPLILDYSGYGDYIVSDCLGN